MILLMILLIIHAARIIIRHQSCTRQQVRLGRATRRAASARTAARKRVPGLSHNAPSPSPSTATPTPSLIPHQILFFETSAKSNINVEEALMAVATECYHRVAAEALLSGAVQPAAAPPVMRPPPHCISLPLPQ